MDKTILTEWSHAGKLHVCFVMALLFAVPLWADTVVDSPTAFEIARDAQSEKIVIAPERSLW